VRNNNRMNSKSHKNILACLSIISIFTFSCNLIANPKPNQTDWDKKNVRDLNINDTAYLFAVKTAQDNISLFIKLALDKKNNGFDFYIKSKFTEEGHVEHMWSIVKDVHEDSFEATIDNEPKYLTTVKYKQIVSVPKTSVEDWIIYDKDSVILGNFIKHSLKE
jgi:uncharacterized protein YegJ (DUF2314 family)